MTATAAQARAPTFFDEVVQATPGGPIHLELCLHKILIAGQGTNGSVPQL